MESAPQEPQRESTAKDTAVDLVEPFAEAKADDLIDAAINRLPDFQNPSLDPANIMPPISCDNFEGGGGDFGGGGATGDWEGWFSLPELPDIDLDLL